MKITGKLLEDYNKIYEELKKHQEVMSENIKTKQDRNGKNEVEFEHNGEVKKLKEEILWQEVYYMGTSGNDSANKLRELYPDVFKMIDEERELEKGLREFEAKKFGFTYKEMTMPNVLKLIEGMVDYKLATK